MKKITKKTFLLIALSLLVMSCASKNKPTNDTASNTERMMKGTWVISDYKIENINENHISLKVFRVIDEKCIKGTQWEFIPNNATGSYKLHGMNGCEGEYPFKWNVVKEGDMEFFQFKYRIEDIKDKNIAVGEAKMRILDITDNKMTIRQQIPFEKKIINIIYTFNK